MKRLLLIIMCISLLCGCSAKEETASATIFAMDTVMTLSAEGVKAQAAVEEMASVINELNTLLSATDGDSLLNSGGEHELFQIAEALSLRTGGAFDPTLHAVTEAWGFPTKEYRIPSDQELSAALAQEKWDLGGIAKGYAVDRCADILKEMDVTRAILDLGGNVLTFGEKADGSPWRVAVRNPFFSEDYLGVLEIEGSKAVVTSGDYQRYFELDGISYHHIIDPATGRPADSGLSSVTIICESGTTADALSTALFVMGLEESMEFWRQSDDFEAVFVTTGGAVYATEGAALTDCEFEVIHR